MLGAGLQFDRSRGEDRFYDPAKLRRNHQKTRQLRRAQSDVFTGQCRDKSVPSRCGDQENLSAELPKPVASPNFEQAAVPLSNVRRFIEAITPSLPAQYLSKTTMRSWRTSDVECQPYFVLDDLWESFKEWSVYGAGVPLVLNGRDSVIQYYVPYLSAIQIYADPSKLPDKSRRTSEDSDGDYYIRDSSSDGSSDSERDRILTCSRRQQNPYSDTTDAARKMERLLLRDQKTTMQEGFSSDDSESGNSQIYLRFQYIEHEKPYCREPLADKISYLAIRFPELKYLQSCDVMSSSWVSVAWYPIYRIPTGPTLKDTDACFLTYHSLYTPTGDVLGVHPPKLIKSGEIDSIPKISLPVFGLASYKFRAPVWTSNSDTDSHLVNSLSKIAGDWLRDLQVDHPDFTHFSSRNSGLELLGR